MYVNDKSRFQAETLRARTQTPRACTEPAVSAGNGPGLERLAGLLEGYINESRARQIRTDEILERLTNEVYEIRHTLAVIQNSHDGELQREHG